MATPHIFRFYILDANENYYYVDDNNDVQTTSTKTALKFTPSGWDKIRMQVSRDKSSHGINTVITAPLTFIKDGAKILRSIYYKDGNANFEAYAKVIIERRNDGDSNIWSYSTYYTALVDFASENKDNPKDDSDGYTVRLYEKNIQTLLQANEDVEYEIPFDSDAINIEMDGVKFRNKYTWTANGLSAVPVQSSASGEYYLVPMGLVKEDTGYFGSYLDVQAQGSEVNPTGTTPSDSNKMLYTGLAFLANYTLTANITVNNTGGASDLQLRVDWLDKNFVSNTNTFSNIYTTSVVGGIVGSQTFSISVSGTHSYPSYPINNFLVLRLPATSIQTVNITVNSINYTATYAAKLPTTYVNSFKYKDFAKKVFDKATNTTGTFNNGFLGFTDTKANLYKYYNNLPIFTHVTGGNAMRGIASAKIKTTWGDLWKDAHSRWFLGYDITGSTLRIEQLPYFYKKSSVITVINNISKFTKTTAKELIYNSIRAGYRDVDLDMLNAKYEVNTEQQWLIGGDRVKAELNLLSTYNAGVYASEYLRSDLSGKDTTDNKTDNDVFLIEVSNVISGGNQTLLKYSSPDTISGVADGATLYNIGLDPRSFVLRWQPYIKSVLNINDSAWGSSKRIAFQKSEKNANAAYFISGFTNLQNSDIYPSSTYQYFAGDRLFKPTFYEFDCEVPYDMLNTILENKYGVIGFYDNNNYYEGFIWDVDINPSVNDKCHMKLLASPNNNQENLIQ